MLACVTIYSRLIVHLKYRGCRGRYRMVVGFITTYLSVPITTNIKVVSSNTAHSEVYLVQHYVIKFVSDLRQDIGFLRFPPPIKLTVTIQLK